jgi:trypsin
MIRLLLLCTVLAGCGQEAAYDVGHGEIVNGTATNGYPEVLILRRTGGAQYCTATRVRDLVALTAAHCLDLLGPGPLEFRSGPRGEQLEAQAGQPFYRAASLSAPARQDDIVAFTMIGQPSVPIAPLRHYPMNPGHTGKSVALVGYGVTGTDPNGRPLRDGRLKRVARAAITSVGDGFFTIDPGTGGGGTCEGDSGGPAFFEYEDGHHEVAGVSSGGDPSCMGPQFFTRVDTALDLVNQADASLGSRAALACEAGYCLPDDGWCDTDLPCCPTDVDCEY